MSKWWNYVIIMCILHHYDIITYHYFILTIIKHFRPSNLQMVGVQVSLFYCTMLDLHLKFIIVRTASQSQEIITKSISSKINKALSISSIIQVVNRKISRKQRFFMHLPMSLWLLYLSVDRYSKVLSCARLFRQEHSVHRTTQWHAQY